MPLNINHMTDDVMDQYAIALDDADTLPKLKRVVGEFAEVADDAAEIVIGLNDSDFKEWRRALKRERQGKFMGKRLSIKYGAILIPATMLVVSQIAETLGVPWGRAYITLKEMGKI